MFPPTLSQSLGEHVLSSAAKMLLGGQGSTTKSLPIRRGCWATTCATDIRPRTRLAKARTHALLTRRPERHLRMTASENDVGESPLGSEFVSTARGCATTANALAPDLTQPRRTAKHGISMRWNGQIASWGTPIRLSIFTAAGLRVAYALIVDRHQLGMPELAPTKGQLLGLLRRKRMVRFGGHEPTFVGRPEGERLTQSRLS